MLQFLQFVNNTLDPIFYENFITILCKLKYQLKTVLILEVYFKLFIWILLKHN